MTTSNNPHGKSIVLVLEPFESWFIDMFVVWYCCHVWAEVEAWSAGYSDDPSGGDVGNRKFASFYSWLT